MSSNNGINDNTARGQQQGQKQQSQQQQQEQPKHRGERQREARQQRAALSTAGSGFTGRIVGRATNAFLSTFSETAAELLQRLGRNVAVNFEMYTMQPGDAAAVQAPLAIALAERNGSYAYYATVVEPGTPRPDDQVQQEGQETYRVYISGAEAINSAMLDAVEDRLATITGLPATTFIYAGASVYYRQSDMSDIKAIQDYAHMCVGTALSTKLTLAETSEPDLVLTDYDASSERLILRAEMPEHHDLDAAGIPVRNDIVMTLSAQPYRQDNRGRDRDEPVAPQYNTSEVLASASMYTDLMFSPDEIEIPGARRGQSEVLYTTYVPTVVITDLIAPQQTPNRLLLALGIAFGARTKSTYLAGLDPRAVCSSMAEYRNIGAMQIDIGAEESDGEFGKGFDANDLESYTEKDHREFLRQNISDNVIFALEIPEFGASAWYMEMFARAGEGDKEVRKELLNAANELTDGAFDKHYAELGGSGEVIHVQEMRYVRGYYHNKSGQRRSSSDVDNVYRFNILGPTNPKMARLAESIEVDNSRSQYYRSAFMHKVISSCVAMEAVGYTVRYHIESAFMVALARAIMDCGVSPELNAPYADSASDRRAHGGRFAKFAGIGSDIGTTMGEVRRGNIDRDERRFRTAFGRNRGR